MERWAAAGGDDRAGCKRTTPQVTQQVAPQAGRLGPKLAGLIEQAQQPRSRADFQAALGLKDRMHFQETYLDKLLGAGWLEMGIPDKPQSRLQTYRATQAGAAAAKTLRRMAQLHGPSDGDTWAELLLAFGRIGGAERKLTQFADLNDREAADDCLAEVRYVIVFAGLGFEVELLGGKGPEFKIRRDGSSALLEVLRFRKSHPGEPVRDVKKAIASVFARLEQVGYHNAVIAIWNDDGDLSAEEVATTVAIIRDEGVQGIHVLPSGLSFVVYGSNWRRAIGGGKTQEFSCFPLGQQQPAPHEAWQRELQEAVVGKLIVHVRAGKSRRGPWP